jgi:biotin-dependent carboxylase-like uncharacterized protein
MLEVAETPPLNSVQDLGRIGTRHYGIGPAGAMDRLALEAANLLLGNPRGAAALEIQMFPARFRVLADTAIALTGANCNARLDGCLLPPWWATRAVAGQTLELEGVSNGVRGYLAIEGGIDVPMVLGSRSTSLKDAFGGVDGRAIAAGDMIRALEPQLFSSRDPAGFGIEPPSTALPLGEAGARETTLRVIPAAEYPQFDEQSRANLWAAGWTVTPRSNRQGYQLAGAEPLRRTVAVEMRSHAIVSGTIQVPPSGQPMIQLADANSAGGYPKIGVVIDADLWRIAQTPPGRALRFVECDLAAARAAARDVTAYLARASRMTSYVRVRQSS